jgi:hypothetical protein
MAARAVRIDPLAGPYESQRGFIFAPADRMFCDLARQIEADQREVIAKVTAAKQPTTGEGGAGAATPRIVPLSSRLIGSDTPCQFDLFAGPAPTKIIDDAVEAYRKTQREIETDLRNEIGAHVREWSRAFGYLPAALNRKLVGRFGKRREAMTVRELEAVRACLAEEYPVPTTRAPGVVLTPARVGRLG